MERTVVLGAEDQYGQKSPFVREGVGQVDAHGAHLNLRRWWAAIADRA